MTNECRICKSKTRPYIGYCLRCIACAIVEWMPDWKWQYLDGEDGIGHKEGRFLIAWSDLLDDQNRWGEVEREIGRSGTLKEEYGEELIMIVYGIAGRDSRQAYFLRTLSPEQCMIAFSCTDTIQEILKGMVVDSEV